MWRSIARHWDCVQIRRPSKNLFFLVFGAFNVLAQIGRNFTARQFIAVDVQALDQCLDFFRLVLIPRVGTLHLLHHRFMFVMSGEHAGDGGQRRENGCRQGNSRDPSFARFICSLVRLFLGMFGMRVEFFHGDYHKLPAVSCQLFVVNCWNNDREVQTTDDGQLTTDEKKL